MGEWKFEEKFFKKSPIQPPNRVLPFAHYHFQMGVTVMGLAEHFGLGMAGNLIGRKTQINRRGTKVVECTLM